MQLEVSHAIYIGKAMSFSFKQFHIDDAHCAMKVGTDGVLLGAWANVCEADRILDVGCGCGLIALMAAQRNRAARVVGVELDAAAGVLERSAPRPGLCLLLFFHDSSFAQFFYAVSK